MPIGPESYRRRPTDCSRIGEQQGSEENWEYSGFHTPPHQKPQRSLFMD
jgi:hypothetical protein